MKRFETEYVVLFEDPLEPDAPAKVLIPAPEWMYQAMQGGELLPIGAHFKLREEISEDERYDIIYNTPKLPPLTEEEAIMYLIIKDIPQHVWGDKTANKPRFKICKRRQFPETREWRNAWRMSA
jgi:hypothetical protein